MVCISSPGKTPTNLFNRMTMSKQFHVEIISYICPPCVQRGVVGEACVHRMHERPPWIRDNNVVARDLFGADDEAMQREAFGVQDVHDSPYCFPKELVDTLMAKPQISIQEPIRFVFTAIDPCAGTDDPLGNLSDFAIVSVSKPDTVIVGMEAIPMVRHQDYEDRLREHIKRIRLMPMYANAVMVYDIEANGNSEWSHIEAVVLEFPPAVIMSDYKRKHATNTTNAAKRDMMSLTRAVLDDGDVRFLNGFVTTSDNTPRLLEEFKKQLLSYERFVLPTANLNSKNTVVFSGKGRNKDRKDDLCLTFQRAIRSRRIFLEDDKYRSYRR